MLAKQPYLLTPEDLECLEAWIPVTELYAPATPA